MKLHEFISENYGGDITKYPYGRGLRRGDIVCDTKTGQEYKVYGVEGSQIVINRNGDTLPEHRLQKINEPKDKLDEFAPGGGSGGDGNGGGNDDNVYNAVLYNKSTGEVAHEEFVDTNEDNARDRVMIGYRGWKLVAMWRNGQPPISTQTANKTSWFVEYQDDDKKNMRLLSLSGRITTEEKAREYFGMYFPSWKILTIRRMK